MYSVYRGYTYSLVAYCRSDWGGALLNTNCSIICVFSIQVPSDFVTFNPASAVSVSLHVECRNLAGQPVLCDPPTYDAVSGMCNHILLEVSVM